MAEEIKGSVHDTALKVMDEYDADVYFYSGDIDEWGFGQLVRSVLEKKSKSKALLILVTYGGIANSAFRISRLLQSLYQEVLLFAPSFCKSAGTLTTLGAHRIILSPFSELGPLDVQLAKRDEIGEINSGLVLRSTLKVLREEAYLLYDHFLNKIKRESGARITFNRAADVAILATGLLQPIYSRLDPEILGENDRDIRVAEEYGRQLAASGKNVKPNGIRRLIEHYPSHDFVIDEKEAEVIFYHIDRPKPMLIQLTAELGALAFAPQERQLVCRLGTERRSEDGKGHRAEDGEGEGSDEGGSPAAISAG